MTQQHAQSGDKQDRPTTSPDQLFGVLAQQQAELAQEAAARALAQQERDRDLGVSDATMQAIFAQLEDLLSDNPEEFVITFIQTEGQ